MLGNSHQVNCITYFTFQAIYISPIIENNIQLFQKEIIERYLLFNRHGPYKIDFYEEQEISYVIIIRRKNGRKSNSKSLFGSGRSLYKKFWNSFKELLRVSSLLLNISAFILCVRYITCVLVCAHVGMICENTTCLKAN